MTDIEGDSEVDSEVQSEVDSGGELDEQDLEIASLLERIDDDDVVVNTMEIRSDLVNKCSKLVVLLIKCKLIICALW